MPTSKDVDFMGIPDLYLDYRYLWRDVNSKSVWRPYVSVDKISDHPYALDVAKWRNLLDIYLDTLFDELLQGGSIRLPWSMGSVTFVKFKSLRRGLVRGEDGKITRKLYRNRHTHGYSLMFVWYRSRHCDMKFKFIYRMRLTAYRWRSIWAKIKEDPSIIFNFHDSR